MFFLHGTCLEHFFEVLMSDEKPKVRKRVSTVGPPSCYLRQKVKRKKEVIDLPFYCELEDFTKSTPTIKIGCSRKPPPPIEESPGPGDYEIPAAPKSTKIPHKICDTPTLTREPITSNIDFLTKRVFPRRLNTTIGERDNKHFYTVNDFPTVSYFTHSSMQSHPVTIGHKIPRSFETDSPGPAKYSPICDVHKGPAYSLAGPKRRHDWMNIDADNAPPPCSYEPAPLSKGIGFTFGDKSRSRSAMARKRKPYYLLTLGTFIVHVDASIPQKDAEKYLSKHKEVREIAEFTINLALATKPKDPIAFIHDYFKSLQPEKPKKKANYDF